MEIVLQIQPHYICGVESILSCVLNSTFYDSVPFLLVRKISIEQKSNSSKHIKFEKQ